MSDTPAARMQDGERAHSDFATAFRDGAVVEDADRARQRLRVVRLGMLPINSGRIAVGDAFTGVSAVSPTMEAIPPGSYPLDLSLVHYEDDGICQKGDVRIAAARLSFSDTPVTRWVPADHGAGVDSGTVAFTDGDSEEWVPDEELSERWIRELDAEALGPSANAMMRNAGSREVALFSSGLGDGIYDAYWGLDGRGQVHAFAIDFDLLITPETIDIELPWPRGRGGVHDETLRAHGVQVRVPWLDPKRLELTTNGHHHAFVRWRTADGRFLRVEMERKKGAYRITPGEPPDGALLYVRIVIGDRPMTVCR
ncbi:MAG: DUF4241 domain-containing protein [Myxococcales bacterium]|nr:DUF4241 domain-containing protein [Myxococcales bacterium]MCB9580217.1 DUF4241 domain-containing protein [Polyangiaceae bacterium]